MTTRDELNKSSTVSVESYYKAASATTSESPLTKGVARFPRILKNWKRKQIVFDGNVDFASDAVDPYGAVQWYKENANSSHSSGLRELKFNCFGDDEIFTFPITEETVKTLADEGWNDVTNDFTKTLGLLTSQRILKEKNFKIWQSLLKSYAIRELEQPDPIPNKHLFVFRQSSKIKTQIPRSAKEREQLQDEEIKEIMANQKLSNEDKEAMINLILDKRMTEFSNNAKAIATATNSHDMSPDEFANSIVKEAQSFSHISNLTLQQIQELCAMKEFLEGKIKFKSFKLKGNVINNPYSNVTLNSLASLFHLPNQQAPLLCGHYTSSIRYAMFGNEKYFKRIRPGQTLQPRQWIAKLHTGWVTSVVAPRRGGKTYRAIDEAVEMFTRDSQDRSRPVRVLFVGINNKKLQTAVKYLLSFTKQFTEAGYFERESSKNIMHYRQSTKSTGKGSTLDDLGTIEFIGSKDDDAGVGDYADLIIIDECERIAENVWEDIMPIITNEGARCILISTLNKNSQKTWFYNQLIQGETEEIQRGLTSQDVVSIIVNQREKRVQPYIDSGRPFEEWIEELDIDKMASEMRYLRQWVGIRFTGEDNDLKTEQEKAFARDRLRGTKAYFPEWWGIFPEDTGVYDYESSIKESDYFKSRRYKYVVVAYDPAESRDKAALSYMGRDAVQNKIEIFKTDKLPNNYTYHGPYIKKALDDCKYLIDKPTEYESDPAMKVFFAYDYNGVGQGLEPFLQESGVRIDMKVRFTGQGGITKKGNNHNVPKTFLVSTLQNALDHNAMIINQECVDLIEEMDHYKGYYNADTGYTKYQAEAGASDDFVSATMIGTYFILEYMGEKYNISKNDIELEEDTPSIDDRYKDFEKYIMEGINNGKTVDELVNGKSQRHSLKRKDVLAQFGY